MKKLLFGIFICFSLIFVMSDNVGAIGLTINLNDYEIRRNSTRPNLEMLYDNDTTSCSNASFCVPLNSSDYTRIKSLRTYTSYSSSIDDIFVLRVFIAGQDPRNGNYSYDVSPIVQKNYTTGNDYLVYLGSDWKQYDAENIYSDFGVTPASGGDDWATIVKTNYKNLMVVEYYFKVLRDGNYNIGFYSTSASSVNADIFTIPNWDSTSAYYFKILNLTQYQYTKSSQEEAAEQEMQGTENIENQTPPSSSETGDGAAATNLISAFSGFVSALGNLSATNCNLTLNFPEFAGGSRVVNVCQNKDKAGNIISVFSSLTLIVFYVPLAIRLLTMIYNEIRSFTNG